jgi:hypothetical protein
MSRGFLSSSVATTSRSQRSLAIRNVSRSSGRWTRRRSWASSAAAVPFDDGAELAHPAGFNVFDDLVHRPEAMDDVQPQRRGP